jgi:hypothetical protein
MTGAAGAAGWGWTTVAALGATADGDTKKTNGSELHLKWLLVQTHEKGKGQFLNSPLFVSETTSSTNISHIFIDDVHSPTNISG